MVLEKYFTTTEIEELKKSTDMINKCEMLVTRLFENRTDKAGKPYIGHLKRVSNNLKKEDEICAALLHDTIEDIEGMTEEILLSLNIPKNIIDMVILVTKTKNIPYEEEINKIIASKNIGALKIKYFDMLDNLDPMRLSKLDNHTQERLKQKYETQLKKIILELKKVGEIK